MQEKQISYKAPDKSCSGWLFHHPLLKEKRPGILIMHAWRGMDAYAKQKAKEIADLGYIAFLADMYGEQQPATNDEEAAARMLPLFLDRERLRQRAEAALKALAEQPEVDPSRIGAIGFCFGGLVVIEMIRAGIPIKGGVSFHGILGHKVAGKEAKPAPFTTGKTGALLVLQGSDDPLVPDEDIHRFRKEMTEHGVDWQLHLYGHAAHSFTNQELTDTSNPAMCYNELADLRSWNSMQAFFHRLF